ncbi:MAG: N-acetylmuramoyl-L-alanine amidase [bacterium]|nr:N-acetylmuramoyl-L-alanine amidase [bacterium]
MDQHYLYATDRPFAPERTPFYRKRGFHTVYITLLVMISTGFILREVFRERPPQNVIRNIKYTRGKVEVVFIPETVKKKPKFELVKISDEEYYIEIRKSEIGYTEERTYNYGSVSKIARERPEKKNRSIIRVAFSRLSEIPQLNFIEDPAKLELTFNKSATERFVVMLDPVNDPDYYGEISRGRPGGIVSALDISFKLKTMLQDDDDVEIVLTWDLSSGPDIRTRREISDFYKADMFISINTNSTYIKRPDQIDLYYDGFGEFDEESKDLAHAIRKSLQNNLKDELNIVRARGFLPIDDQENAPYGSIAVVTRYLTDDDKKMTLSKQDFIDKVSECISKAVKQVADEKK